MKIELTLVGNVIGWSIFDPTNSAMGGQVIKQGTAAKLADAVSAAAAAVREHLKQRATEVTAEAAVWV